MFDSFVLDYVSKLPIGTVLLKQNDDANIIL